jgi:putative ABC transport system substrate-binding protein
MPVIGFLSSGSAASWTSYLKGFREGLKEAGFIDGQNTTIEYRWAEGQYDRLASLAADLVNRKVAVILAAGGGIPAKAAKAATPTIPIVFVMGADPFKDGIIRNLNRPDENITGVSLLGVTLEAKRLGLLHEVTPAGASVGILVNPTFLDIEQQLRELQAAAAAVDRQIRIVRASTTSEIDTAIGSLAALGVGALQVAQDAFFQTERERLVALAARYKLPAMYGVRTFVDSGGLISYATDFVAGFHQGGVYVGKILKGATLAELPVLQPTKFELVINLKTAKTLGLTMPASLIARADEVIE